MNSDDKPRLLAAELLDVAENLDQLRELVVAERAKLEEAGFSPAAAEHMAAAIWIGVLTSGSGAS